MNNHPKISATEQTLEEKYALLQQQVEELNAKLMWYEEQFRLSQSQRYGTSSEKIAEGQLRFFDEAEQEQNPAVPEPDTDTIVRQRKKQKKEKNWDDLPTEQIHYELTEEELTCPQCEGTLHDMSQEVRKELKVIPAQVIVVEHIRHTYACRNCEKNDIATPIITAPMPAPAFPGSLASSSLAAYVMNRKYTEAIPLYRQEQQLVHMGLPISRQTLANWMIKGAHWFEVLYDRMHHHMVQCEVLHADETELQVLKEPGRTAARKSYMWHYSTGHTDPPILMFEYQTTRANKHPEKWLSDFSGYLHTDGYAGYNNLTGITIVGCFAHARRKFTDTLKAIQDQESRQRTVAQEGLTFCNRLFDLEKKAKDLTPDERHLVRQQEMTPILTAFHDWLKNQKRQVLPKTSLGQAVTYCLNQWEKLERVLLDGRLELSNNRAERGIKPFVIGRKNWLFSNTPKGAMASAVIYSVIETAKANGLSPFPYLTYLFDQLPNINLSDPVQLDQLLPWSDALPDECRSPLKKS